MMTHCSTIVELLCRKASVDPTNRLYTFITDRESEETHLTLEELDRRARAIASWLQSVGASGKPVLLFYPPGLGYVEAFFGCLYAGAIAVPSYPPRSNPTLNRIQAIAEDSHAAIALTTSRVYSRAEPLLAQTRLENIRWLESDKMPLGLEKQWQQQKIDPYVPALLQYTSGSTALPKGVIVTHNNLMHNQQMIQQAFDQAEDSIIVGWLPLYHDMGLIGNVMQPLYTGARCILMSPVTFLRHPYKWLQAISRYRATTSGGPNFAYDLCTRRISPELRKTLDLSSWKVAFNGAEPIVADTLDKFAEAFEPSGFRKEAFYPCYGLAEATLVVSVNKKSSVPVEMFQAKALEYNRAIETSTDDEDFRRLVSCGKGLPDQRVSIVHPERLTECLQNEVGEIWVSSPSVAQGYWNRPEETAQTFHARILNTGEGPFLRTGDLGFIKDGKLTITGRLKDLIIIRGLNYYPQDIELTVERCHSALRPGCGAAFSVEITGEERLVLVHEVNGQRGLQLDALIEDIRLEVMREHELQVYAIILIRAQSIPKTSSGKIQRNSCKARFLAGSLEVVGGNIFDNSEPTLNKCFITREAMLDVDPAQRHNLMLDYLYRQLAFAFRVETSQLESYQSTYSLGIDSLMAAELSSRIEADFGITLDIGDLLQSRSIAQLATQLLEQLMMAPPSVRSAIGLRSELSDSSLAKAQQISGSMKEIKRVNWCNAGDELERIDQLSDAEADLLFSDLLDGVKLEEQRDYLANLTQKVAGGMLPYRLSYEQERLWFLDKLRPGDPAYNITVVIKLSGNLSVDALEQALNELVQRHESLRTYFDYIKYHPVQIIAPSSFVALPVVDLSGLSIIEREKQIGSLIAEQSKIPFNLSSQPLLRTSLWRIGNHEHRAVFTLHHIISDFWSTQIFFEELATTYEYIAKGEVIPTRGLSIQYVDFVCWQRKWLRENLLDADISYWKKQLSNAPTRLELPTDHQHSNSRNFRGACQSFELSSDISNLLDDYACAEGVTPFIVMLAGFKVLLHLLTQQNDILVGAPISGRNLPETKQIIGFFAYPLVLRNDLSGNPTFQELTARVHVTALAAYTHWNVPFARVMEAANPERRTSHLPLFQVIFNFLRVWPRTRKLPELSIAFVDVLQVATDFDLSLTVVNQDKNMRGVLAYDPSLFEPETVNQLIRNYCEIMERCLQRPQTKLSEFKLGEELEGKVRENKTREKQIITIAATFTAEPIEQSISFWMEKLNIPSRIEFAPYNQVFQQLLDPLSLLRRSKNGINILLIRFEDWMIFEDNPVKKYLLEDNTRTRIELNVRDILHILQFAVKASATPYLVCLCPSSPAIEADISCAALFKKLENQIALDLAEVSGIYFVRCAEPTAVYQVSDYYDSYGDQIGHIPFTTSYFAALGTFIARQVYALHRPPLKVIVLDCDGTLWKGVCGEDGAFGIEIDPAHMALQKFIIAQYNAGRLICLCSKNNEEDVLEVFNHRTEMPIGLEHLVAWRINWQAKSQNLISLAEQLQLGLDSFIFIDDDPVECAEIEAKCPEVLTLQLPEDSENIPRFLNHIWALDRPKATEEDKKRTSFYRANISREHFRKDPNSLGRFISELNLEIQISEMKPQQLPRVFQLIQRTNQFNFTTIRRSESEIQQLCQSEELECLVVEVKDRFGNYGLVGTILFFVEQNVINVDTFLLSCRALGRGVEVRMLAELGNIALDRSIDHIHITLFPTARNQPALDFLQSVGVKFNQPAPNSYFFKFPAEFAATLTYNPETPQSNSLNPALVEPARPKSTTFTDRQLTPMQVSQVTTGLYNAERILDALNAKRRGKQRNAQTSLDALRTPTEEKLASIWGDLLGVGQVSIHDDFFDLGGHSLLATQLLSRVREAFGVEVPISSLFTDKITIKNIAVIVERCQIELADSTEVAEIITELDQMTDEEITALLAADRSGNEPAESS
jgi:FkbH-like protein